MRAKYQICEIEDLDPKTSSEWWDHSYIPFQTNSIGSSLVKLKIKCHICIEAYVTHSHSHQFLS
jgi:hypothetical protein